MIDSGVDWHHPDLAANIWTNPGESCPGCASDGIDNDGNGYVDDVHGWDFVNDDNDPIDDHGHGTHVAGTIGAVRLERGRRCRRELERPDHAAEVHRRERAGNRRRRGPRDPVRDPDGRGRVEQLLGRGGVLAGPRGRDRGCRRARLALRGGRGQQREEHGHDARLSLGLRPSQRPHRRRHRPERRARLVLELREAVGRPGRAGHEHLLDLAGRHLPVLGRHVYGSAARDRGRRAREGGLPVRERSRPEGPDPAYGRPERLVRRA